jgi:hypothetical protein
MGGPLFSVTASRHQIEQEAEQGYYKQGGRYGPENTQTLEDKSKKEKKKIIFFHFCSKSRSLDSGRKSNKKIDNFYYYL